MVPADSRRISRVLRYSGAFSRSYPRFRLQDCHLLWFVFPERFDYRCMSNLMKVLQPHVWHCYHRGLGSSAFDRLYLRNHFCFLFLLLLRCFSSQGLPLPLSVRYLLRGGLPHSEIRVSMSICLYTRLIAAYHVLRRLREPRHPLCALVSFLYFLRFLLHY